MPPQNSFGSIDVEEKLGLRGKRSELCQKNLQIQWLEDYALCFAEKSNEDFEELETLVEDEDDFLIEEQCQAGR